MSETNGCAIKNGGCEQLCLPSGAGSVCTCTVGFELDGSFKCKGTQCLVSVCYEYMT